MKNKTIGMIIYFITGAALLTAGFTTTERGLKEDDRKEYERVIEDRKELGDLGFTGFSPLDYKTAFSNGEKDFVLDYRNGEMEITEREAVYEGLVGSIYQNGDEYEVVVPVYETWIATGANEQLSAVIWHESFHAYQNSYFHLTENSADNGLSETELAERIDRNPEKRSLYEKELEILGRVADADKTCDFRKTALEYLNIAEKRDELLSADEKISEDFYELSEGSAYYVESMVVRYENGDAVYEDNYLKNAASYSEGNSKYYHHGMLQCMLLDGLDPDWKSDFAFDCSLDEVIAGYCE